MRFRRLTTESAGFYNTAGFNDDTRAFFSIPARHDLARRIDCAYLSELVIQGRLAMEEAVHVAVDLAYQPAQKSLQAVSRLNAAALARLPAAIARPAFDPANLKSGIVHLGIGAFHRAHQAVFTEDAIAAKAAEILGHHRRLAETAGCARYAGGAGLSLYRGVSGHRGAAIGSWA